jgi:uncharacterized protein (DUF952 family)
LALERGVYQPPSLAKEGFIHLSTAEQWRRTAARFFAGQQGLLLLELDVSGLDVRFEAADGESFPHLYGPLPVGRAQRITGFVVDAAGAITQEPEPRVAQA